MKAARLALAVGILLMAISAFAQFGDPYGSLAGKIRVQPDIGEPRDVQQSSNVDDRLTKLAKELKLTDGQQQHVRSILEDEEDRMQQLNDSSFRGEAKRSRLTEIHQTASKEIGKVLNDDQQPKFADFQKKHKKDWQ